MTSTTDLVNVIRHFGVPAGDGAGDPELLDRYARGHDQAAFATLVRRYGPLVLGVARRQLADRQWAEDVFQSTFLALARSGAKLGGRPVLANWLYTVALRHARKVRARTARRAALELAAPPRPGCGGDPLAEVTGRELVRAIDDELARLPDRLRLPVLLCCIQGLSREEAAQRLGCSEGVVKGRLERGRRRLAARLAARGLAPSALLLAPLAAVTVPAHLLARAVELAEAPWSRAVPAAVAELAATQAPRAFFPTPLLTGCVLVVGLIGWAVAAGGQKSAEPAPSTSSTPVPAANTVPDDPLPAGAAVRFGSPRFRHPTAIESLAVSPDGKVAVACSGTRFHGKACAYDLTTGLVRFNFDASVTDVEAVAFSPDGKTIARRSFASQPNDTIYLHDAATGRETGRITCPRATEGLEFSPDGKRIAVMGWGRRTIHVLDIAKGEVVRTLQHTGVLFAFSFSPDGKSIAGGGYDVGGDGVYFARLWDVETGKQAGGEPTVKEGRWFAFGRPGIRAIAFSADGSTLVLAGDYGKPSAMKLFDTATGKERSMIPFPEIYGVRSVAFSPDGKTIAAAGVYSTRLFDTATGKELVRIDKRASGLRFSPDGKTLVGGVAGTIYRWDAATGKSLIPEGADSPAVQIAVTGDGKRVITRGQEGDVHVWDARTGEHQRRLSVGGQRGFAVSPDGRFLVWAESDAAIPYTLPGRPNALYTGSQLRMIDLTTGTPVQRFGGFEGDARDPYFLPDGNTLVTVDYPDGRVRVWDVAKGRVERSFVGGEPGADVWRSRLSPDGKVLAVTCRLPWRGGVEVRSVVKLWDLASGKELDDAPPHWVDPEVSAFSPDGKTMAVATPWNGTVQFRDAETGKVREERRGPGGSPTALAFGPGGHLYSGSLDATVLGWDLQATKPPAERK